MFDDEKTNDDPKDGEAGEGAGDSETPSTDAGDAGETPAA